MRGAAAREFGAKINRQADDAIISHENRRGVYAADMIGDDDVSGRSFEFMV